MTIAMSETKYDQLVSMLTKQSSSPLQMIQALNLLARIAKKEAFYKYFNDVLEKWRSVARAFVSVLHWTEFAFQNDDAWIQLPVSERLALVWMHADRVIYIFVSQDIDLEQVATNFADNLPSRPVEQTMRFDPMYDESPVNPRSVDDAAILYFGLRQILQDRDASQFLLQEQIEKISDLLMDADNQRMLSPWLFMAKNTKFNQMCSYFVEPPVGLFDESVGPNMQHIANLQEKAFADLEGEPNSAICWSFMKLFLTSGMTKTQREKMSGRRSHCIRRGERWYQVNVEPAPNAFFTYRVASTPYLTLNPKGFLCTNALHKVSFMKELSMSAKKWISLSILSDISQLSLELNGRHYGNGVLKIEPSALKATLVTIPSRRISEIRFNKISKLIYAGNKDEAAEEATSYIKEVSNIPDHVWSQVRTALNKIRARRK